MRRPLPSAGRRSQCSHLRSVLASPTQAAAVVRRPAWEWPDVLHFATPIPRAAAGLSASATSASRPSACGGAPGLTRTLLAQPTPGSETWVLRPPQFRRRRCSAAIIIGVLLTAARLPRHGAREDTFLARFTTAILSAHIACIGRATAITARAEQTLSYVRCSSARRRTWAPRPSMTPTPIQRAAGLSDIVLPSNWPR